MEMTRGNPPEQDWLGIQAGCGHRPPEIARPETQREFNHERVEQFERSGRRFGRAFDREVCWHVEP